MTQVKTHGEGIQTYIYLNLGNSLALFLFHLLCIIKYFKNSIILWRLVKMNTHTHTCTLLKEKDAIQGKETAGEPRPTLHRIISQRPTAHTGRPLSTYIKIKPARSSVKPCDKELCFHKRSLELHHPIC